MRSPAVLESLLRSSWGKFKPIARPGSTSECLLRTGLNGIVCTARTVPKGYIANVRDLADREMFMKQVIWATVLVCAGLGMVVMGPDSRSRRGIGDVRI